MISAHLCLQILGSPCVFDSCQKAPWHLHQSWFLKNRLAGVKQEPVDRPQALLSSFESPPGPSDLSDQLAQWLPPHLGKGPLEMTGRIWAPGQKKKKKSRRLSGFPVPWGKGEEYKVGSKERGVLAAAREGGDMLSCLFLARPQDQVISEVGDFFFFLFISQHKPKVCAVALIHSPNQGMLVSWPRFSASPWLKHTPGPGGLRAVNQGSGEPDGEDLWPTRRGG